MSQQKRTGLEQHRGPRMNGPIVHARDRKGTILRIWNYLNKQKTGLIASVVLVVVTTLLGLAGPYMIGIIIDDYILARDMSGTVRMLYTLAGIYIAASVFTWLQTYIMINVSLKTIGTLRMDLFTKLQSLSLRFFDRRSHGDLMSRVTNDIDNLNMALSQSVTQIVSSLLTIIGITIAMFSLDWIMAIISLLIIPLIVMASKQIIKRSSRNYAQRQKDLGELNGYIEESIINGEVVTLFGKEQDVIKQFHSINENLRSSSIKADITSGLLGPLNNFINNIGLGLLIAAGALLSVNGYVTIGVLATFVTYSRQFFRPINQLSNLLNTFQSAIAGAERVFEMMDEVPDIEDQKHAIQKQKFDGNVVFENVDFAYDSDKPVLRNISFTAKAGEMIALVGPTGSGKTTIINLLTRFYDIQAGRITIDGHDIKQYQISNLRQKIGVVLQDTYLFSGTIADNIRYGRLDASDEEVMEAAKIAHAHAFIKYLPKQYDTFVASGGTNLSHGQRQLISIARAILEDADILILDEATSNIDTRTEVQIQKGLSNLMRGRTSFVIAHRLKTIQSADRILVIHEGEILEQGNHESLIEQHGFYEKLYRSI
ncbi:MAG: ABC transporter ATP-binding protein [Bacillus sp. (in: firmicutes)]